MQNQLVLLGVFISSLAALTFGHLAGISQTAALFGAVASVITLTHLMPSVLGGVTPTQTAAVAETAKTTVIGPPK
jgi:hypothetical protein